MHRANRHAPPAGTVAVLAACWLGMTAALAPAVGDARPGVAGAGVGAEARAPAAAASPTPAPADSGARRLGLGGKFADTPVRQKPAAGEPLKTAPAEAANAVTTVPAKPSAAGEAARVCAALAAVLGLIFFLRWAARRLYKVPVSGRASGAVQVLSRTVLSPKQQLVLLQVGRRVIVVADGGAQMSALCQITEPDEVASLVGQLRSEKDAGAGKAFGSLFGRMRGRFEPQAGDAAAPRSADVPISRGSRLDLTDSETNAQEPNIEAIDDTRQELNGLLEKVRLVSGQFSRM